MTTSKPTILVLGATGKVGAEVVRLLAEADDSHIVVGIRSPEKVQSLHAPGIEYDPSISIVTKPWHLL